MEPDKIIEIYSEKHKTSGRIEDYGLVIKLIFTYEGREADYNEAAKELAKAQTALDVINNTIEFEVEL